MKSIRYFYSPEYKEAVMPVLLDANGQTLGALGKPRNQISLPRLTICSIYDDETQELSFGISRCSEKDLFVKSIGREKALKRAEENPIEIMRIEDKSLLGQIFIDRCLELENEYYEMKTVKF